MTASIQRKLTTILAADAEGYSRLMEADEIGALRKLQEARAVFTKFIDRHSGRIANTAGDGLIADFPSVVEAVQCAIEVQQELGSHTGAASDQLRFRIGVHLGDVIVDGNDLLGEGVNLAARLQTMAEPGGVLISQQVYDQVHAKLSVGFDYLGEKRPRNYSEDVPVYRVAQGPRSELFRARPKRSKQAPDTASPGFMASALTHDDPRAGPVIRQAQQAAVVVGLLFAIDLLTGSGFWAHWPALVAATIMSYRAAPVFFSGFKLTLARVGVIIGAMSLIDLFS